jgi:hypothetical protein
MCHWLQLLVSFKQQKTCAQQPRHLCVAKMVDGHDAAIQPLLYCHPYKALAVGQHDALLVRVLQQQQWWCNLSAAAEQAASQKQQQHQQVTQE